VLSRAAVKPQPAQVLPDPEMRDNAVRLQKLKRLYALRQELIRRQERALREHDAGATVQRRPAPRAVKPLPNTAAVQSGSVVEAVQPRSNDDSIADALPEHCQGPQPKSTTQPTAPKDSKESYPKVSHHKQHDSGDGSDDARSRRTFDQPITGPAVRGPPQLPRPDEIPGKNYRKQDSSQ